MPKVIARPPRPTSRSRGTYRPRPASDQRRPRSARRRGAPRSHMPGPIRHRLGETMNIDQELLNRLLEADVSPPALRTALVVLSLHDDETALSYLTETD